MRKFSQKPFFQNKMLKIFVVELLCIVLSFIYPILFALLLWVKIWIQYKIVAFFVMHILYVLYIICEIDHFYFHNFRFRLPFSSYDNGFINLTKPRRRSYIKLLFYVNEKNYEEKLIDLHMLYSRLYFVMLTENWKIERKSITFNIKQWSICFGWYWVRSSFL